MANKRCNGEGTISQRNSDNRWIGQLTIGAENGKQKRVTCSDKTQQGCKRKLDELKKKFSNTNYVPPTADGNP